VETCPSWWSLPQGSFPTIDNAVTCPLVSNQADDLRVLPGCCSGERWPLLLLVGPSGVVLRLSAQPRTALRKLPRDLSEPGHLHVRGQYIASWALQF
jgi:hypothetical protein